MLDPPWKFPFFFFILNRLSGFSPKINNKSCQSLSAIWLWIMIRSGSQREKGGGRERNRALTSFLNQSLFTFRPLKIPFDKGITSNNVLYATRQSFRKSKSSFQGNKALVWFFFFFDPKAILKSFFEALNTTATCNVKRKLFKFFAQNFQGDNFVALNLTSFFKK